MCQWGGDNAKATVNATEVPTTGDLVCAITPPNISSPLSSNEVQLVSLVPLPVLREVQRITSPQLSPSDEVQEIFIGGSGSEHHV